MQRLSLVLLIALLSGLVFADEGASPATPAEPDSSFAIIPVFDDNGPPPGHTLQDNPFNALVSMNSWTLPILDHSGKPHDHGHVIQLIADGGNGVQDSPNPDGTPGGDDSLADGNFNMTRLMGLEEPFDPDGKTGMFFSRKYFVPFSRLPRAYYLRLWEGDNIATAPYYQDTVEYAAGSDRGGSMIVIHDDTLPTDTDWKFGPSQPRPKPEKEPAKNK